MIIEKIQDRLDDSAWCLAKENGIYFLLTPEEPFEPGAILQDVCIAGDIVNCNERVLISGNEDLGMFTLHPESMSLLTNMYKKSILILPKDL